MSYVVDGLREEHRLRMSENRLLRSIFRPKGNEVSCGCRKLCNEEFHNFHPTPSLIRMIKSRRMRWTGHIARILRRPIRRWVDNIFTISITIHRICVGNRIFEFRPGHWLFWVLSSLFSLVLPIAMRSATPRPFPSKSLPIYYSSVILQFDAIHSSWDSVVKWTR
jgi:hypothetical protein